MEKRAHFGSKRAKQARVSALKNTNTPSNSSPASARISDGASRGSEYQETQFSKIQDSDSSFAPETSNILGEPSKIVKTPATQTVSKSGDMRTAFTTSPTYLFSKEDASRQGKAIANALFSSEKEIAFWEKMIAHTLSTQKGQPV